MNDNAPPVLYQSDMLHPLAHIPVEEGNRRQHTHECQKEGSSYLL